MYPTSKASHRTTKQPAVTIVGRRAIESGAPLFVRRLDGYWVPGDAGTRERALRMLATAPHGTHVYGIEALP